MPDPFPGGRRGYQERRNETEVPVWGPGQFVRATAIPRKLGHYAIAASESLIAFNGIRVATDIPAAQCAARREEYLKSEISE